MTSTTRNSQLSAVGARIRDVRVSRGFSQEGLAAEAGLDRAYYGSVERGERNVSTLNLIRIAAALGVEVSDLFPTMKELTNPRQ
jgi:transcriptional regulator with XRE-family HTH domain